MVNIHRPAKHGKWSIDCGHIASEFQHYWRSMCFLLPLWEMTGGPYEIAHKQFGTNNGIEWGTQKAGQGLDMPGTSGDYIDFTDDSMMPSGAEAWSVLWWLTPGSQIGNHNNVLLQWGSTGANAAVFLGMDSDMNLRTDFWSNDIDHNSHAFTAGEECVIGIVHDPDGSATGTIHVYCNGELVSSADPPSTLNTGTGNLRVGGWTVGSGREFVGDVYLMAVFKDVIFQQAEMLHLARDPAGLVRPDWRPWYYRNIKVPSAPPATSDFPFQRYYRGVA